MVANHLGEIEITYLCMCCSCTWFTVGSKQSESFRHMRHLFLRLCARVYFPASSLQLETSTAYRTQHFFSSTASFQLFNPKLQQHHEIWLISLSFPAQPTRTWIIGAQRSRRNTWRPSYKAWSRGSGAMLGRRTLTCNSLGLPLVSRKRVSTLLIGWSVWRSSLMASGGSSWHLPTSFH